MDNSIQEYETGCTITMMEENNVTETLLNLQNNQRDKLFETAHPLRLVAPSLCPSSSEVME